MLLPDNNSLSKKQTFGVGYFFAIFPNNFKMRQSLIAFKFLVDAQVIPSVCTSYIINYLY